LLAVPQPAQWPVKGPPPAGPRSGAPLTGRVRAPVTLAATKGVTTQDARPNLPALTHACRLLKASAIPTPASRCSLHPRVPPTTLKARLPPVPTALSEDRAPHTVLSLRLRVPTCRPRCLVATHPALCRIAPCARALEALAVFGHRRNQTFRLRTRVSNAANGEQQQHPSNRNQQLHRNLPKYPGPQASQPKRQHLSTKPRNNYATSKMRDAHGIQYPQPPLPKSVSCAIPLQSHAHMRASPAYDRVTECSWAQALASKPKPSIHLYILYEYCPDIPIANAPQATIRQRHSGRTRGPWAISIGATPPTSAADYIDPRRGRPPPPPRRPAPLNHALRGSVDRQEP
jgi:hypothetical protein